MCLPYAKSDNRHRADRVIRFAAQLGLTAGSSLLDVGSGLGVFPAVMKERGWICSAIDPDPVAVEHIRTVLEIDAVAAEFVDVAPSPIPRFHIVSLNKVLEHVADPVPMLRHAARFLDHSGIVYIELPDAEGALADAVDREEFFVEHFHAFSMESMARLANRADQLVLHASRIREPSGKYTLIAFLAPRLAGANN